MYIIVKISLAGSQNQSWGLWNMVRSAAEAVTPTGPGGGGFGDPAFNGGTNGQQAAIGFQPNVR